MARTNRPITDAELLLLDYLRVEGEALLQAIRWTNPTFAVGNRSQHAFQAAMEQAGLIPEEPERPSERALRLAAERCKADSAQESP